jgi:hypothetical protein
MGGGTFVCSNLTILRLCMYVLFLHNACSIVARRLVELDKPIAVH